MLFYSLALFDRSSLVPAQTCHDIFLPLALLAFLARSRPLTNTRALALRTCIALATRLLSKSPADVMQRRFEREAFAFLRKAASSLRGQLYILLFNIYCTLVFNFSCFIISEHAFALRLFKCRLRCVRRAYKKKMRMQRGEESRKTRRRRRRRFGIALDRLLWNLCEIGILYIPPSFRV